MTTINSVTNGTLANYGAVAGYYVPQQLVNFDLSAVFLFPNSSSLIEFFVGEGPGSIIFELVAVGDGSNNLDVTINVGEYGAYVSPTSGNNTFTLSGTNTITVTGQASVDSINPTSGSVTLTTTNGSVVWDNLSDNIFLGSELNQISYWNLTFSDYASNDYTTTMLDFNFSLQGSNLDFFDAQVALPNFSNGVDTVALSMSGVSFVTPEETGISYILDGGSLTATTDFFLSDNTSSDVVEAVPGGSWVAIGPTVMRDFANHTITVYSDSNPADSVTSTFYSGGLYLSLDQLSGVTAGEFPAIMGNEGDEILGDIYFALDGGIGIGNYGVVSDYVPATVSGGVWTGVGPSAPGGVHTLQVSWQDTSGGDSGYGGASVSSNTITYTIPGGAPSPINIMIV